MRKLSVEVGFVLGMLGLISTVVGMFIMSFTAGALDGGATDSILYTAMNVSVFMVSLGVLVGVLGGSLYFDS